MTLLQPAYKLFFFRFILPSSDPARVFDAHFLNGFTGGLIAACKTVGCVWLSGETPQLKGKIYQDKIDIAGSVFALLPAGATAIDGSKLAAGNKIVLIASSGPHENGFTTLRALADKLPDGYRSKLPDGQEFWQAINAPSVLYTPLIQSLLKEKIEITNLENITGHGWQKPDAFTQKPFLSHKKYFACTAHFYFHRRANWYEQKRNAQNFQLRFRFCYLSS